VYELKKDIRMFFGRNIPNISTSGVSMTYHIFSIVVRSVFFGGANISFEEFFVVEVKKVFEWLYERFKRESYKQVIELLNQHPRIVALEKPMEEVPSEITSKLNKLGVELKPYQKEFLYHYYNATHKVGLNGFLMAFEQGLGKTFTAIATVYAFDLFPCIITAPKSTLLSWKNSITALLPNKFLKEDVLNVVDKFYICNYEALDKVTNYITSNPKSMIVDEIQNFRYANTARVQNVKDIQDRYKIKNVLALSGTPIKALASEFVPVMTMLDPMFAASDTAQRIFKHLYNTGKYDAIASAVLQERLKLYMIRKEASKELNLPDKKKYDITLKINNIKPFTLPVAMQHIKDFVKEGLDARNKSDVSRLYEQLSRLLSLFQDSIRVQGISYGNDYLEDYYKKVKALEKMDPMGNDKYKEFIAEIRAIEKDIRTTNSEIGKQIIQTRKEITSYRFILMGKAIGEFFVRNKIRLLNAVVSENLNTIKNIIDNAGKKVLIFSTFREPLATLHDLLKRLDIESMLVESAADFNANFNKFKDNPNIRVMLGTIQALGTGTDGLQYCCDTIIFLNRPFRSTDLMQAESRIHRQGQDSTCHYYYINVDPTNPNVLSHEELINQWSKDMLSIAGLG
jgi:SNF2 family DNA or RNA helicase